VHAAARYLCATGAHTGTDIPAALYAYNHDPTYVHHVLATATSYTQIDPSPSQACGYFQPGGADASSRALAAVRFGAQLGKPYVWGGNGETGFDCSGLTQAAYAAAGIDIPAPHRPSTTLAGCYQPRHPYSPETWCSSAPPAESTTSGSPSADH
jgi:NlpC/P60 family